MAEGETPGEKTEAATPRRRQQAEVRGDRLVSRDLGTAATGIAGALWLMLFAAPLASAIAAATVAAFTLSHRDLVGFAPARSAAGLLEPMALPLAALAALLLLAAVAGQALSGGVGIATDLVMPKASRLDPLKGLGRMFGPKGAIELLKALAKAAVLLGVAGLLLWQDLPLLLGLSAMPPEAAVETVGDRALRLLLWLTLGLALIAAADLPWQLMQWLKRLRMSRQELKDEAKQQEGDPNLRAAVRRMGRDAIRRSTATAMKEASVVLTNPTHFAVALRYDPAQDEAPLILARGRGPLAEAIMMVARERDVAVLRYPAVARALYFTGRVGQRIRPDLYAAVATILAFVRRVEAEVAAGVPRSPPPLVEPPVTARFDPNGRPLAD